MKPREGMEVLTLDMRPLGTIQRVWPTAQATGDDVALNTSVTPDAPPGPLAKPGVFLVRSGDREMYIPFGAIDRIDGNRVVLGVPFQDVDRQGWEQRPWRLAS